MSIPYGSIGKAARPITKTGKVSGDSEASDISDYIADDNNLQLEEMVASLIHETTSFFS